MFKSFFKHVFLIFFFLSYAQNSALAVGYEGARISNYDSDIIRAPSHCNTGNLGKFNIGVFSDSREVLWVLTNPACYGFMIGTGVALSAAGYTAGVMCEFDPVAAPFSTTSSSAKVPTSNMLVGPIVTKLAMATSDCILRGVQASAANAFNASVSGAASAQAAAASASVTRCCIASGAFATTVATAVGVLGIMFETAQNTFKQAKVCGYNWYSWKEFDVNGTPRPGGSDDELGLVFNEDKGGYWRRGSYANSYSHSLDREFMLDGKKKIGDAASDLRSLTNKRYREFLFGGVERVDEDGGCSPPSKWNAAQELERLGYVDDYQRYYMRGPGLASHYACERYITTGSGDTFDDEMVAFDCCIARSRGTLCIENKGVVTSETHRFCSLGTSSCMVSGVGFNVYSSNSQINTICAKTDTLCPFDHLLGGGTEIEDMLDEANGSVVSSKVENYCQFNKHCVKVPGEPYIRIHDFQNAFISGACMDFVGHSQNTYSNESGIYLPTSKIKNFSAPLAECMTETLKNMIQNKAGFTRCANPDESPRGAAKICGDGDDSDAKFTEGDYEFREGDVLSTTSPFQNIQNFLRGAVKLVLILSVVFLGYGILLALKPVDRKKITTYLLKFAFVVYFALGTGWQDLFIDNIFKISSSLGGVVMNLDVEEFDAEGNPININTLDGCQFPKFDGNSEYGRDVGSYPSSVEDESGVVTYPIINDPYYSAKYRQYATGFDYLKVWDTLDCKFVKALGFGPQLSVPNLILTIFAGLLTGGLGIIFVMFTFIFAFFYVALIMRALHVFLVSTIAIAILIFVSPITITTIMFEKTKSIFNNWLKQLTGFIIQPVILFAYIGLFIAILDYAAFGIRSENTDASNMDTYNGGITFTGNGLEQPKGIECRGEAEDNSIYCIFEFTKFGSYSGLEPIGIVLPFIFNINKDKLNAIIKAGLLMFIFSQFMNKISTLAAELTGSSPIGSSTPSAADIGGRAYGVARGVQKRGTRALAKPAARKAADIGKGVARNFASSGTKSSAKDSGLSSSDGGKKPSGGSDGGGGSSSDA